MKFSIKIIPFILLSSILMFSCNGDKIDSLEKQNAALLSQKTTQDSLLNDFMNTFNTFEENLEAIKERENLIALSAEGDNLRTDQKEKIIDDIQMINTLLEQNRMLIDELTLKAEQSESKNKEFRRMISRLKKQLANRDNEIGTLKNQLVAINFELDSLNTQMLTLSEENQVLARLTDSQNEQISSQDGQIESQAETIESQQTAMNTAFFVSGTKKELKDAEVIEGKRVSSDVNENAFTRIDIREIRQIPLGAKKAEIMTAHPNDSYVMTDEDQDKVLDHLQITDPERFWKTSKYLVIVKNK